MSNSLSLHNHCDYNYMSMIMKTDYDYEKKLIMITFLAFSESLLFLNYIHQLTTHQILEGF